jgi:hypothetical protein
MKKFFATLFAVSLLIGCTSTISENEAKTIATEFVNDVLLAGSGKTAEIIEISQDSQFFEMKIKFNEQEIISYLTLDGKKFIPEESMLIDVDEMTKEKESEEEAKIEDLASTPKNDKPKVEIFVMSHCPYGTQIEKGILPVLDKLGDKIDFELKFCDYAMHDKKELDEQILQYVISQKYPKKIIPYLEKFLEAGNTNDALAAVGLQYASLQEEIVRIDQEFKVTENFEDKDKTNWKGSFPPFLIYAEDNKKYGVRGSPSFVLNGKKIETSRSPAGLLKAICAGFENPPEECNAELSSETPKSGFGFDGSGSDGGSCG